MRDEGYFSGCLAGAGPLRSMVSRSDPSGTCLDGLPRGTRFRLRPMGRCFNRISSLLRPQPHSRSPRSLRAAPSILRSDSHPGLSGTFLFLSEDRLGGVGSQGFHMRVRGPAGQAEGTETEWCGKSRDPLPSAREAGPRTVFPTTKHRSEGMGNLSSTLRYLPDRLVDHIEERLKLFFTHRQRRHQNNHIS